MDYLSAAQAVLEADNRPLHFRDIARRAIEQRLIIPSGATPEATMGSRLYVDTQKPDSRFERRGKGHFALRRRGQTDEIAHRVGAINAGTRQTLHRLLLAMPADRFEELIGVLLIALGFDEATVQVTSYSGDGGVDVRGVLNAGGITSINAAVQVKRWKRNVQAEVVRTVRGSLTTREQGIIITTSDFSSGARAEAEAIGKVPISLINGPALVELVIRHGIGVKAEPHTVLTLDDEWWVEASGVVPAAEAGPAPPLPPAARPARKRAPAAAAEPPPAPPATEPSTAAAPPPAAPPPAVAFPVPIRAANKPAVTAALLGRDGRVELDGQVYRSPSTAARAITGWKSANGWVYWQFRDPATGAWRPIDALRHQGVPAHS